MDVWWTQDAGRTLALAVKTDTSVKDVMALVTDCELRALDATDRCLYGAAASVSDRYLSYGGTPLRASRSLQEYGIQDHATLELSRRLRGGCFSISILLWIIIFICCLISVCTCGLSLPVALCLVPFALILPVCCL